jgi:hypothetical protein
MNDALLPEFLYIPHTSHAFCVTYGLTKTEGERISAIYRGVKLLSIRKFSSVVHGDELGDRTQARHHVTLTSSSLWFDALPI